MTIIVKHIRWFLLTYLILCTLTSHADTIELSNETLQDKIRGGLLGQIIGNLNGIPHEFQYIMEPGEVTEYTPALPEGARTDDDTDFEWVYIYTMQQENEIFLSKRRIAELWKERINRRIWCSNLYARCLMDLGIEPPLTGRSTLNPWAEFNISGQFLCETFGLIAPAMPQSAAKIGLNYTSVAIDLEPAQTTQLFTAMIATAFTTNDIEAILDAGKQAVDPPSEIHQIIEDVIAWHRQYPNDWKTTRRLTKEKYLQDEGRMRDRNGYELNTSSILAALLYGKGDFVETMKLAFNFGWDADCNAATCGTILGTAIGYRAMLSQGWDIVDRYKNTTRDNMPMDETITSFADRLVELSEQVIVKNGGKRVWKNGRIVFQIPEEQPATVSPMQSPAEQIETLRESMKDDIKSSIINSTDTEEIARSCYLAICLDLAPGLKERYPKRWNHALGALNDYWKVMQVLYNNSDTPAGRVLQQKASEAGLKKPEIRRAIWE